MDIYVPQNDNVTVHFTIGTVGYKIHLYLWRGLTYADVDIYQEPVLRGARVIANRWILPEYRMGVGGNFRFEAYESDAKDYVEYSGFNKKFRLCAYPMAEVSAIEGQA